MRVELDLHRWVFLFAQIAIAILCYMDVSKHRGTPKWMVYNGKPDDLEVPLFLERPIFLGVPTSIYFS